MKNRANSSYSVVGESIFVIGGNGSTLVEEFLVRERRWRSRAPLAVGRICHAAAVVTVEAADEDAGGQKTLIGVFGGYNKDEGRLSSREVYDLRQDRWFKLPDLRENREGTAAACLPGDSRVFVFGGSNGPFSFLASVEFCQLGANWQERVTAANTAEFWLPTAPMRIARSQLAATHFRGQILIAGGYDGQNALNVVEMFSPPDASCPRGQWTVLAGMKQPRDGFILLTSTGAVFALGGVSGSKNSVETLTSPAGSSDSGNDLTSWIWSSRNPVETLSRIRGAASIRM